MGTEEIVAGIKSLGDKFDSKFAEFDKRMGALERRPATDNALTLAGLPGGSPAPIAAPKKYDRHGGKGFALAKFAYAQALIKRNDARVAGITRVSDAIDSLFGDKETAHLIAQAETPEAQKRAVAAGIGADGGFAIPEVMANEIIEILRPISVVMGFGPRELDLVNGNLTLPRGVTGSTAAYKGEVVAATKSQPTFGQKKLDARFLAVLVPVGNRFLTMAPEAAIAFVRDDIVASYATKFDATALRGAGSEYTPTGIRYLVDSGNVTAGYNSTTPTLTQVQTSLYQAIGFVQDSNKPFIRPGWVFCGRTERYIRQLRDGNGGKAFPEMDEGKLLGYPFKSTENIPKNLGIGTNESEILFGDFDDFIVGRAPGMEVKFIPDAAYDENGTVKAGASTDESVYRLVDGHDFQLRHSTSFGVLNAVKWGA